MTRSLLSLLLLIASIAFSYFGMVLPARFALITDILAVFFFTASLAVLLTKLLRLGK